MNMAHLLGFYAKKEVDEAKKVKTESIFFKLSLFNYKMPLNAA